MECLKTGKDGEMLFKYIFKLWFIHHILKFSLVVMAALAIPSVGKAEISDEKWIGKGLSETTFIVAERARRNSMANWMEGNCGATTRSIPAQPVGIIPNTPGLNWLWLTACRPEMNPTFGSAFIAGLIWMAPDRSQTFKIDPAAYWPGFWETPGGELMRAEWDALPYPPIDFVGMDLVFFDDHRFICRNCPGWHQGRTGGGDGRISPADPLNWIFN